MRARILLFLVLPFIVACAGAPRRSASWNPVGWPAKGLSTVGWHAADSEWPIVREVGWLFGSVGELAESPALLVEGLATLAPAKIAGGGRQIVYGTGATVASAWNLPFALVPGRAVDLGREAELVNAALIHLETVPPETWHLTAKDTRATIFPPGTRVRAAGKDLVWEIPGRPDVLQTALENPLWNAAQRLAGMNYAAQERTWGFIVPSKADWDRKPATQRVKTLLHEFVHQDTQLHELFLGWSLLYWPAYLTTFPFSGWTDHWAELGGTYGAGVINRALYGWQPPA